MKPRRGSLVTIAVVGVLAAACSKGSGLTAPPSSAFPSGTNTVPPGVIGGVPTGAIGPGGTLPSGSPGAATGNLSGGQVSFHVSGDINADVTLTELVSTAYTPPPGVMAIVWTAGGTDPTTVGIGGASFVGTMPTSPILTLAFVAVGEGFASFTSMNGECSITIDTADASHIAGSFTCTGLSDGTNTVDVSGAFQASG